MKYGSRWVLCSLAAVLLSAMAAAQSTGDVTLKIATYSELGQIIRALKGNVIVVDFWAHY
jgi:hypothetical protein